MYILCVLHTINNLVLGAFSSTPSPLGVCTTGIEEEEFDPGSGDKALTALLEESDIVQKSKVIEIKKKQNL